VTVLWRLLFAALAVAAAVTIARGLAEGDDYLGDGRYGYGAFAFGPFIALVCGYIAVGAPLPPRRGLWVLVLAAYAALAVVLLVR
jgi:hypothetical protein